MQYHDGLQLAVVLQALRSSLGFDTGRLYSPSSRRSFLLCFCHHCAGAIAIWAHSLAQWPVFEVSCRMHRGRLLVHNAFEWQPEKQTLWLAIAVFGGGILVVDRPSMQDGRDEPGNCKVCAKERNPGKL